MNLSDKNLFRSLSWPVLFFSTIYFLLYPDWHAVMARPSLNTLLLKDKANRPGEEAGKVTVNDSVISEAFDLNAGREDALPIERELPASRPFWKLAYKPHAAEPRLDSTAIPNNRRQTAVDEAAGGGAGAKWVHG